MNILVSLNHSQSNIYKVGHHHHYSLTYQAQCQDPLTTHFLLTYTPPWSLEKLPMLNTFSIISSIGTWLVDRGAWPKGHGLVAIIVGNACCTNCVVGNKG